MSDTQTTYMRFNVGRRIEHLILFLSFTLLAITGLAQKFPTAGISQFIVTIFGGIELMRIVHRTSAIIFVLQSIYHLVVMGYKLWVKREEASMMPGVKDIKDAFQTFLYNLGIKKEMPKMGRYNFAEKVEYLAMLWGLLAMALTGFMLWNPILVTRILPGVFIPAAKAMHGMEAILAVLAIIVWHFYSVHLKHWNWSMIRGTLSREEMEEEHAQELEQIEAGYRKVETDANLIRKRSKIYFPIAIVISLALAGFLFWFLSFEDTALATVLPEAAIENAPVYAPLPPTPTPLPQPTAIPTEAPAAAEVVGPLTWDNGIGALFSGKCTACHGAAGGLDLSSYNAAMKGGANGVMIVAGDAANSPLVKVQQGKHPAVFNADELAKIIDWINAGALEK